ncbi:MAG TPA: hypothetical protein VFT31_10975 [Kribbella sp.]|nr:hypothetical protein [Kribbella sp.]
MTSTDQQPAPSGETGPRTVHISPVDVATGAAALVMGAATGAARRAGSVLEPVARAALRPPLLPPRFHPARFLLDLGRQGAERRESIRQELAERLDALVPVVLDQVLRRIALTELVLQQVDLDGVVAAVDIDAVAARLDIDTVVRRVDVDSVAGRLDIEAVLDRLDLTSVVLQRVDLDAIVQAILAQIDLAALAQEVIEAVDLPEIIRESTGSMASDTVRGARMRGISADEAVSHAVDRLLLRRGHQRTPVPRPPAAGSQGPGSPAPIGRPGDAGDAAMSKHDRTD